MRLRGRSEIGGEIDAIVRRAARSTRGAIDEHVLRTMSAFAIAIDDRRARNRDRRGARLTSALVGRSHRSSIAGKVSSSSLSLSDLGSLFSLSLFDLGSLALALSVLCFAFSLSLSVYFA